PPRRWRTVRPGWWSVTPVTRRRWPRLSTTSCAIRSAGRGCRWRDASVLWPSSPTTPWPAVWATRWRNGRLAAMADSDDEDIAPGAGLVNATFVGTGLLVGTSVAGALAPDTFGRVHAVLSCILFAIGTGALLWAY